MKLSTIGSITGLSSGLEAYLQNTLSSATKKTFVGIIAIILCILVGLVLSITRISRKISAISNEVVSMIDNINAGKGDLTVRVKI